MNIRRKASGIAFSATLLASLVAVVAAPLASAAVSVTSAGTVPAGGTSTGTASFQFTENSANCFSINPHTNALRVTILDNGGAAKVHFVGTPVVTAPGSLGATAQIIGGANNELQVSFTSSDKLNIEQVTVSGLQISADTTAATGAIGATLTGFETGCVLPATTSATGVLQISQLAGATNFPVNVTSACPFVNVGAGPGPAGDYFINGGDSGAGGTTTALAAGVQTLTTAAFGSATTAGQAVTQAGVPNCSGSIASPGTVAAALTIASAGATQVNIGENNQPAGAVSLSELPSAPADSLNGESVTFTITAPATGVLFSVAPPVSYTGGATGPATCSLSVDRHSCTVTGIANSGAAGSVVIHPTLDVDTTATAGTAVTVTATPSPAIAVNGGAVTIAFVGRVIVSTADQPTVFIGFNDQPTGTISFTEQGPGFFVAGVGGNNTFAICPETGETFTRAPWAVVTTGNLMFLSGVIGAAQVKGTLATDTDGETCAYWTVFSASTTASTIEVRGSADDVTPLPTGVDNGPRVNVPKSGFGATPGSTQMELLIGTKGTGAPGCVTGVLCEQGFSQVVSNAIRAFKNNISATASSQPNCVPGSVDCLGGNIVVTETQNGQFKAGDLVTVRILPRSTTQRQDVILKTGNTNDLPIVTANTATTGFAVTPVGVNCPPSAILGVVVCQFTFSVTQQAFGPGLASFTISNIHYITAADAVNGPVLVEVTNTPGAGQPLDVVVSNATVGPPPTTPAATTITSSVAVGLSRTATFGGGPVIVHAGSTGASRYAIFRFSMFPSVNAERVEIWVATKNNGGSFGPYVKVTTRAIEDGTNNAYYWIKEPAGKSVLVKAVFTGNASHGPFTSHQREATFIQ